MTPTTPIKDTVEALRQLIDASEIRHVGLSEAAPGRSAGLTSCTRFETVDAEVGAAPARVALARLSAIRPSAGDRYADMSPING